MKKIVTILVVGLFILSGFVSVVTSYGEIKELKLTVNFKQISILENNEYITLELKGTNSVLLKEDYYMVPTLKETFKFPFGTEIITVNCTPKNIQKQELTKELMKSPTSVLAGQTTSNKNTMNCENTVSMNIWYDYDIGCGIDGEQRSIFVEIQAFPVQYHPSLNIINWAKSIDIEIKYKEPKPSILSFDDEYKLIILTPGEFSDELSSLMTHKINRGISTRIVTLDEIYGGSYFPVNGRDDQEKIKYFIKNAIENWNTLNVLIVGGRDKFPTRETHVYLDYHDDDEIFVSDLYYADIYYKDTANFSSWDSNGNDVFGEYNWGESHLTDEVDLYPDVHLGRLACVDSDQVIICVNKIITYETNEAYTQPWFSNIVVIGGDSAPGDDDNIDEGEYVNQAVLNIMDGFIPDKIWDSNNRLSGILPSGLDNINNGINSGCGFVDFSGHGAVNVWTTYPHNGSHQTLPTPWGTYRSYHVSDLENGDKLPIVVIGACSVGKFNQHSNCFSWSFVSNPDGGGIASFGATGLDYFYLGKYVISGLFEKICIDVFDAYNNGAITFGELWSGAIVNYMSTLMDDGDYKTVEEFQAFGDPTLAIAKESLPPDKPDSPDGPSSGSVNIEHTYTASTTDPDGDKLNYLFDWGDGSYSNWIGPKNSGQSVSASHTWTNEGNYQIKVLAKDIHGVQSEWSDPLSVSMPKKKAINPFLLFLEKLLGRFTILEQIIQAIYVKLTNF